MSKIVPKALFFDYDGLLIKSVVNPLAWVLIAYRHGVTMDPRVFYLNEGNATYVANGLIQKCHLEGISSERLVEEKKEIARILMQWGVTDKPFPGTKKILEYSKAHGIKTGIVTGTHREVVRKNIPQLYPLFDFVVAADDTFRGKQIKGKPDPQQYQVAISRIRKFRIKPDECVVLENSPLGIQAAKAADLYCIALMTTLDKQALINAGADLVLPSHQVLYKYIKGNVK